MSLLSNLPVLRNYLFLRNKIAEHGAQLSAIRDALSTLEQRSVQNSEALERISRDNANLVAKQVILDELRLAIKKNDAQILDLAKQLNIQIEVPGDDGFDTLRKKISAKFGVESAIHPEDHIYNFVKGHEQFHGSLESALEYYFSTGAESAEKLVELKSKACLGGRQSLLEFASGYGCVSRHLKKHPEEFQVTACDIHEEAVQFTRNELGVECIGSFSDPSRFSLPTKYGMVFALSFFSHMPRRTWSRWVKALFDVVEPGGCLVFTTHGNVSHRELISHAKIDSSGFWFNENSEQSDLDTAEYGTTITTPEFVREEIKKIDGAQEVQFCEGFWWTHQDAWVIRKSV
jgi:SAM-dependent methyltransferase